MLEDQVAFFLQKYLGNYIHGLNKEALKISVWKGDVELSNMQLRPEALNALKLPVRVKAGFLGSVRLKVPWSRLGQEPVLVYLDRILILAEPATQVEGSNKDAIQEAKRFRVRELEMKMLESQQQLKNEMSASWIGSLINTIIGNIKLSISNIHIRYEDIESNPGHPFAAGLILARLSAFTVDDSGKETFATGGALDRIQKSVELEGLALYFDSNVHPWSVKKPWTDLHPSEWSEIFELGILDDRSVEALSKGHSFILQPVSGNAQYIKLRLEESRNIGQALQNASVNLDSVTLCLSKDGYRDILKLVENFAAFNQRLRYAHYRPNVSVKADPKSWWKYAYKVVTEEMKMASGNLSWERLLRYTRLRKRYVSLYASLLKTDTNRLVVDDNKEVQELDRELDIELILQWRMLAHRFVQQSAEAEVYQKKQKVKRSWWSIGWASSGDGSDTRGFTEEDWKQLNELIGFREGYSEDMLISHDDGSLLYLCLGIHMSHNASRLITDERVCLADLSCEQMNCSIKFYSEAKVFDLKLGSYKLSSPYGLLAESATLSDSLVGEFSYKPINSAIDWSFVAKASPCYMTYLKESIDGIVTFFKSNTVVSQTVALETAAAVQMTIDGVKRTAQEQVSRVLKDQSRFFLDLDIAAPKITIPTKFFPDGSHEAKLMIDLGNLLLCTEDLWECDSPEKDMYMQFNVVLADVSAFLVDGDYQWGIVSNVKTSDYTCSILPVIDNCGVFLALQQSRLESSSLPALRLSVRLPSLEFHFSPARFHRLMPVAKIFVDSDDLGEGLVHPWNEADFEGWLSVLSWKGMGTREAVWQRRYVCLVGPFLYVLENPSSRTYKQYFRLSGKQLHLVPTEYTGGIENVLAMIEAGQVNTKVVEDVNALIFHFDSDEARKTWQNRLQATIYRASGSTVINNIAVSSQLYDRGASEDGFQSLETVEKLFVTGILDELKICFSYDPQSDRSFQSTLLGEEKQIFEFRAIGGQVELSMQSKNILIGILLKSLEIEDQFQQSDEGNVCYLARSFINITEGPLYIPGNVGSSTVIQTDDEDKFFEASDNLDDQEPHASRQRSMSEYFNAQNSFSSRKPSREPPRFKRSGLIPDPRLESLNESLKNNDVFDSFVKAQMVIYNQDSHFYNNLDNRVIVSLAMLSFYCQRPTILAILNLFDAINIQEGSNDSNGKLSATPSRTLNANSYLNNDSDIVRESSVKGLLGTGKNRVLFYLTLNMARAQIFLMNESRTSLATLLQNNLLTDIKVFPTSFSIKACLGNLKISDDSLSGDHPYYWVCHMRNPGGSSFVELDFMSFSSEDDDFEGYDYSLVGQFSEVRIIYLNRFVQEVVGYFMGLTPSNIDNVINLKDKETNAEKWFTSSELQGSPAVKLDLSLRNPVILMPRRTDSLDYLELDVLHITMQNTFLWLGGDKSALNAVHLEILTIKVKDINLIVCFGKSCGESIIHDVNGLSVVIQRSLRDLLHKIPATEVAIKIEDLKASLSCKEYEMLSECALSNVSETPHLAPMVKEVIGVSSSKASLPELPPPVSIITESSESETWVFMKVSVAVDLVELCLHSGIKRDSPLSSVQARGAWLLYKSSTSGEAFLFATLKGFSVIDDRHGTKEEFKLAIGHAGDTGFVYGHTYSYGVSALYNVNERMVPKELGLPPVPSMLVLDVKFKKESTNISLCIQRPKLLVALDFLLAVVEFFVPSLRSILSNKEDDLTTVSAIILEEPLYRQSSPEFSISPHKPLIADIEQFDHFIYDGGGGKLYLQDRSGRYLCNPSYEMIIYVGNGKHLQFKNVTIVNGLYLDSCIFLGANSSYSASENDHVFLAYEKLDPFLEPEHGKIERAVGENSVCNASNELTVELQAIGPELTFYKSSNEVNENLMLSNKVMHAQMDVFCRLVLKGDGSEMHGSIMGLNLESNGISVLEPFDTSVKFSRVAGKTNINLVISDIFMNFSFGILRLFISVEEDIIQFLRMTSKKVSVICSQFDKVGTICDQRNGETYAFWRPCAPSGFAVLGDCLTPLNEPPAKGVIAVNTNLISIRKPILFKLIWTCCPARASSGSINCSVSGPNCDGTQPEIGCSVWFPVAPKGYVAVGCIVSPGRTEPSLSSTFCILSSLVSPCSLKDCIALEFNELSYEHLAFWRVENSFASFIPAETNSMSSKSKPYEFRHILFERRQFSESKNKSDFQFDSGRLDPPLLLENSALLNSGRLFEVVASFRLVWWNQGTASRKKISVWRPICPPGMVYLGDIAIQGYESPNSTIVFHDRGNDNFLKVSQDYQLVAHIKKCKGVEGISFWLPQAPPGYVALGCIASRGVPKHDEFSCLRCIRNDLVTTDQFPDESIWDASDANVSGEPFSLWNVDKEVGSFIARTGYKKPPKRLALKLVSRSLPSVSDNMIIDAEIRTFSAAVFDDYGGLMVPLLNVSFGNIGFSLHGSDSMHSTASFCLAARSYNDQHDLWEPLIEPMDGFVRYQYDAQRATTQLRMISTKDLNVNISASIANIMLQAYSSWDNLSSIHESYKKKEAIPSFSQKSIFDIHHKKSYYIIPQNKLGQDVFIQIAEVNRISNIIKLPTGDNKPLKVPISKNMLDSHMRGNLSKTMPAMVTIIILDAELLETEALTAREYMVSVRLFPIQCSSSFQQQQSARTCGALSRSSSSGITLVSWNEAFFFKIDSKDSYMVELIVIELGRGECVGTYSAELKMLSIMPLDFQDSNYETPWREFCAVDAKDYQGDTHNKFCGRIKCAALVSMRSEINGDKQDPFSSRRGFLHISPSCEGPWTSVRLNYATRAACWRLGNDVVACEVAVNDGNRYVTIRSLVSITNNTDFLIDLCLLPKDSISHSKDLVTKHEYEVDHTIFETNEVFEVERYSPLGWVSCSENESQLFKFNDQGIPDVALPDGWEWIDDWHFEKTAFSTPDGWVNAQDSQHLRWPELVHHTIPATYARQRKWVRHRKFSSCKQHMSLGPLGPKQTLPLPLSVLSHPTLSYFLQLKPKASDNEYSWSIVLDKDCHKEANLKSDISPEICVSNLIESHEVLYCSPLTESSSNKAVGLWFCLSIETTETGKDIHSDPIHDWNLKINSPLSITNFLPYTAVYKITVESSSGEKVTCSQGNFASGETAKIYNIDLWKPLYLSISVPSKGWQPMHEPSVISHPRRTPSRLISLKNSSGRIAQVVLEQNYENSSFIAKSIKVYAPFWISSARCPPINYHFIDMLVKEEKRHFPSSVSSENRNNKKFWKVTDDDLIGGYSITSALNFKLLGLSASISQPGKECFGDIRCLSPLGDMDGSVDLYANDTDGNCFHISVSSKPSPFVDVPTKVISLRPFMTFTNRFGQDIYIKLSAGDQPKILGKSASRKSFIYQEAQGQEKLQIRLEDTNWCFPFEITKDDTVTLVLRNHQGGRSFVKAEIRGYDDGSRFLVIFRRGSTEGPIRIENRTMDVKINIRQSGLSDDSWILLEPCTSAIFSWEDTSLQKLVDVGILHETVSYVLNVSLENTPDNLNRFKEQKAQVNFMHIGEIMIMQFIDDRALLLGSNDISQHRSSRNTNDAALEKMEDSPMPFELIIEFGVVGISLIDHRPRELLYIYLENFFASYCTGYDAGTTTRFKLIVGHLQVDNQLPLTLMPVLLAPEDTLNRNHPVFKATITIRNDNTDGIQVYPYVYIRVTERCWKLNIHEPIIWALKDVYSNLQIDSVSSSSGVTQVDPEIRIDLIDVSEIRLKLSLEIEPTQRPPGVLGIWSPVFSAVGNAFKIQVHLRKVMHQGRFMRRSSIAPAILNRVRRDLIQNPLHLILSVDVLSMTKSTLSSLSKGFAELSTDGQFLQLRSKQIWSRRITGVSAGILQGTEAFAQGVAFGVSGVLTKPVESARQNGFIGLAHGLGRAFIGFIVQPLSGAFDFVSLTVDGISASYARWIEILSSKAMVRRIRNPRAIHADGLLREYCEREAVGQMVLYLAETSRHLGCTDLFKEPSKFAWSDYYEDFFMVPNQRIVLVTNKRVMLLQCLHPQKLDKKPSKILWDVPWEDILALELAKAGYPKPTCLIIHLKSFRKMENFVRLVKCETVEDEDEPQAVKICSSIRKMWRKHQSNMKVVTLKVPASQRYVHFAWDEANGRDSYNKIRPILKRRGFASEDSLSNEKRFVKHSVNFQKIWSSEQERKRHSTLFFKQVRGDRTSCTIWRPSCPDGYVSVGDVAHVGIHPPNVAAVFFNSDGNFAIPAGFDLVWRSCPDDYSTPVSIWLPRPTDGFVAVGCVAVSDFEEPLPDSVYCVNARLAEETAFEDQVVWRAHDSYPWSCYIYQVQSEALQFVALRQQKDESEWKPKRVYSDGSPRYLTSKTGEQPSTSSSR